MSDLIQSYVEQNFAAHDQAQYFTSKIEGIRASTASSTSPNIVPKRIVFVIHTKTSQTANYNVN